MKTTAPASRRHGEAMATRPQSCQSRGGMGMCRPSRAVGTQGAGATGRSTSRQTGRRYQPTASSATPPQREQLWGMNKVRETASSAAANELRARAGQSDSAATSTSGGGSRGTAALLDEAARMVRALPKVVVNTGIVTAFLGGISLRLVSHPRPPVSRPAQ